MRVTTCDECGERERVGFQRDGVCRECRGSRERDRSRRASYVRPDHAEQHAEALDHAEQRARARTIQNPRRQA